MSTEVIEPPQKTVDFQPEKTKPEKPKEWNVILHNDFANSTLCCTVNILREVFNKRSGEAFSLARIACEEGRAVVFTSSKDIAEQKAMDAEDIRMFRASYCGNEAVKGIHFSAEP